MPGSSAQWVCKAPNAFRPERILYHIFAPSSLAPPFRRNFSQTSRQQQEQAATAPDAQDGGDGVLPIKGPPKVRKRPNGGPPTREEEALTKFHANNIDPSSLANTVKLHQDANAKKNSPVRKFSAYGNEKARGYRTPNVVAWASRRQRARLGKQEAALKATEPQAKEEEGEAADIAFEESDRTFDADWFEHLKLEGKDAKSKGDVYDSLDKGKKIALKKAGKAQRFRTTSVLDYKASYVLPFAWETAPVTDIPWFVKKDSLHGIPR
jgi:hypothetical protein